MNEKRNSQEAGLITGFILGLGAFLAYDILSEEEKRQKFKRNVKKLSQDVEPYLNELKYRVESSEQLKHALIEIDKNLGSNFYSYITKSTKRYEDEIKESKSAEKVTEKAIRSVKKFFKKK